ncbi:MAG: 2OG-Fe(II) oxygenase [Bdellovibrionales bacterium]|nr:2OG-Fe(II) oxygenase [Oligoflexia bacterium]
MDHAAITEELAHSGFSLNPQFFNQNFCSELRSDIKRLKEEGKFIPARVGKGAQNQVHSGVRRNELCWLDREAATKAQAELWTELDQLKQALNRNLFLGIHDFEGHYAIYPPGGFYQRHRDTFASDPKRVVSLILYLNESWNQNDGGQLRIYEGDSHRDIEPVSGTLLCFLSKDIDHEVLTSHADRLSFTGWFRTT